MYKCLECNTAFRYPSDNGDICPNCDSGNTTETIFLEITKASLIDMLVNTKQYSEIAGLDCSRIKIRVKFTPHQSEVLIRGIDE